MRRPYRFFKNGSIYCRESRPLFPNWYRMLESFFPLLTVVTVLSWRIISFLERFISTKDGFSKFACNFSFWTSVSCHFIIGWCKRSYELRSLPSITIILLLIKINYTLRLLGGRHPLCGSGVTSMISVTSMPLLCSVLIADSRPLPGPFTYTLT